MKILLIGDASNYHNCLATGLRGLGHDVTVASNGSRWMDTHRDIDIGRRHGKLGGALLWLRLNTVLASDLRGYDIVQLCGTNFIDQRPVRIDAFFDKLKRTNGHVFMTMLGNDPLFVRSCIDNPQLRYNDFVHYGKPSTHALAHQQMVREYTTPEMLAHGQKVYDGSEGIITALYEYHKQCQSYVASEKLQYVGIPVDTQAIKPAPTIEDGPLRIMLACHRGREIEKGVDVMLPILQEFAREQGSRVKFDFVQNVPLAQFQQLMQQAHVIVDQLYSYTPATTALMAMAQGKVVVSGAEPEYYDFIGEQQLHPIINAEPLKPEKIKDDLLHLVEDRERVRALGEQGRRFVEKHNDVRNLAASVVDFWERRMR